MQIEGEQSEAEYAEANVLEQLPNPVERRVVLRRLLASADAANALAPNAWAVTLFSNGFRLNVGQVETVVFVDGELRVNLSGTIGIAPFVGPNFVAAAYRSMPQPQCAFVGTVQQYMLAAEQLESAHEHFIQKAATTSSGAPRKGTPFRSSHCEELMQYARALASDLAG